MIEFAQSSRIYVDTNIWIYYIEANPAFLPKVIAVLLKASDARARLVTSELAVAECLIRPSRENNQALIALYENFFTEGDVETVGLDGALTRRAARAGGPLGLKLIDAIHLMSAREAGCSYFLTGDARFKSATDLTVVGIE
jgi:predicted nucleic acid-binding protein